MCVLPSCFTIYFTWLTHSTYRVIIISSSRLPAPSITTLQTPLSFHSYCFCSYYITLFFSQYRTDFSSWTTTHHHFSVSNHHAHTHTHTTHILLLPLNQAIHPTIFPQAVRAFTSLKNILFSCNRTQLHLCIVIIILSSPNDDDQKTGKTFLVFIYAVKF